jgi:hypothetical protein
VPQPFVSNRYRSPFSPFVLYDISSDLHSAIKTSPDSVTAVLTNQFPTPNNPSTGNPFPIVTLPGNFGAIGGNLERNFPFFQQYYGNQQLALQ